MGELGYFCGSWEPVCVGTMAGLGLVVSFHLCPSPPWPVCVPTGVLWDVAGQSDDAFSLTSSPSHLLDLWL